MSKEIEFLPPSEQDGTVIVKLAHAVKFRGEETSRVTIPALKGRHLMRIPFRMGTVPTIGQQAEWADYVVEPNGILEELHPSDAFLVAQEVYAMLGKSLATGEQTSE